MKPKDVVVEFATGVVAVAMIFSMEWNKNDAATHRPEHRANLNQDYTGIEVLSNEPTTGMNPASDIEAERCGADCRTRDAERHLDRTRQPQLT